MFVGIEIGGSKLQIVTGDESATIADRYRFEVKPHEGSAAILSNIERAFSSFDAKQVKAVGVGFGGPVDTATGKIWKSYHVSGWSEFNLKTWIESLTPAKVVVENDANVAALGESIHGAGKEFKNVFYITLGSGVGGGLVVDGEIFHGTIPGETEMGHIRLDRSGRTVQDSCSGWAINEKIKSHAATHPESALAKMSRQFAGAEAKALSVLLEQNDVDANALLKNTMDDLAFGLSHVVHLLHPEVIIIGGGLSLIGEPIRNLVERLLPAYVMDAFQPGPSIRLSALREDAVPVGALQLAIQNS